MPTQKMILTIIDSLVKTAKENKSGNPFSAAIYNKKKKKYFVAMNSVKTDRNPLRHAEINALEYMFLEMKWNPKDCIIISSGEPCLMCLGAIAWSGIKEVFFIDDYHVANQKGFKFDNDSLKLNEELKLGLKIKKIIMEAC